MATVEGARFLQNQIKYQFKDERLLLLALTAAGKGGNEDEGNKRGNSRLAHLGNILMQFILTWVGFWGDRSRADTTTLSTCFSSTDHCAKVAEKAQLDRCLKYDIRSGSRSAVVLRKAVHAVVAAIFIDSQDLNQVLRALIELRLFGHEDFGVDPRLLSADQSTVGESIRNIIIATAFQAGADCNMDQSDVAQNVSQTSGFFTLDNGTGVEDPASIIPMAGSSQLENISSAMQRMNGDVTERDPPLPVFPDPLHSNDDITNLFSQFIALDALDALEHQEMEIIPYTGDTSQGTNNRPERPVQEDTTASHAEKRRRLTLGANSTANSTEAANNDISWRFNAWLAQYLSRERDRCRIYNCSPPEATFFTVQVEERLQVLDKKHRNTLVLIQIMTASSHAIAALREMVCSYRRRDDFQLFQIEPRTSAQALFYIIERLDENIALYVLLRRYHILRLYEECVPANSRACTRFIMADPSDFQRTKRAGNPGNNAKSEVTRAMMREICPGLDSSVNEYKSKYRKVSKLQILGRRYHSMTHRFNKGILGLLPPSGLAKPYDMGISDDMIMNLPEPTFAGLMDVLDQSQGDSLRAFGDAAFRLIKPLVYSASSSIDMCVIEKFGPDDIIQYPKGSQELLELLH